MPITLILFQRILNYRRIAAQPPGVEEKSDKKNQTGEGKENAPVVAQGYGGQGDVEIGWGRGVKAGVGKNGRMGVFCCSS
jgi:hypothetical protein